MVKKDLKIWSKFREGKKSTITHKEYEMICDFHANYLDHPLEKPCKCSPKRINKMIFDLNKIYDKEK